MEEDSFTIYPHAVYMGGDNSAFLLWISCLAAKLMPEPVVP